MTMSLNAKRSRWRNILIDTNMALPRSKERRRTDVSSQRLAGSQSSENAPAGAHAPSVPARRLQLPRKKLKSRPYSARPRSRQLRRAKHNADAKARSSPRQRTRQSNASAHAGARAQNAQAKMNRPPQ